MSGLKISPINNLLPNGNYMIELTPLEARVIGALIEKEITTPDQYPLSLKGLTVACNQKSNREPVLNLEELQVQDIVDALSSRNLAAEVTFGGRVTKYKHRFCNTEFSQLHLNKKELAVVCVLFLRGPQTPGELRSRSGRLCDFADVSEVESVLQRLQEREDGPFVVKLEREPGKRESRYSHLFSGEPELSVSSEFIEQPFAASDRQQLEDRVLVLEDEVELLRKQVDELKELWQ